MQLTHEPARNIAYLRPREPGGVEIEMIRVSDELNLDLAPDGSVYGIELLNANAQLHEADAGRLVLELAGTRTELRLPEVAWVF